MAIKYLCHDCCKLLGIESNEIGTNEAGRKNCYGCGGNTDWRLHTADQSELDPAIDAFNTRQQAG